MKILIKSSRDPLNGKTRSEVIEFLSESLSSRCSSAYIFGSIARNQLHARSDIDCIIVLGTELPFTERSGQFDDLRDHLPALEILVYTPEEFTKLTSEPSRGFWTTVTGEMIRIV